MIGEGDEYVLLEVVCCFLSVMIALGFFSGSDHAKILHQLSGPTTSKIDGFARDPQNGLIGPQPDYGILFSWCFYVTMH